MGTQKLLYRIKGCGCDCATIPADPCQPCNAGAFQIRCRSRTGTAILVGYNEFTAASNPPKKYRVKQFGGSFLIQRFESPGCTGAQLFRCDATFSGSNTINDAGVETIGGQWSGPSGTGPISTVGDRLCNAFFGGLNTNQVLSRLRQTYRPMAGNGNVGCSDLDGVSYQNSGNSGFDQLSSEDTEEAAMARAIAPWGPWGGLSSCCTNKEARGAGIFSMSFTQSEYQIRVAGSPGSPVMVELTFSRSPGAPYSSVFQDIAQSLTFPADPEAGWTSFLVSAPSGGSSCLESARLYVP
jgi:hypothetical protein